MKKPGPIPLVVLVAALVLVIVFVVRLGGPEPEEAAPEPATAALPEEEAPVEEDAETPEAGSATEAESGAMRHLNVLIYFPSADGDGLVGEPHEIFNTTAPGDRAKQILADLISGPETEHSLRALPPGTQLRQVYMLEDGTAFLDFSADLQRGLSGGSTEELYTVYSIINSVSLNIPEIRRVGILIDGEPVDTFNGHMDLRRPLTPNVSIISRGDQPMVARAAAPGDGLQSVPSSN